MQRENKKNLKSVYHKAKDISSNSRCSPSTCPYYGESDQVVGTALSTEPNVMLDGLLRLNGFVFGTGSEGLAESEETLGAEGPEELEQIM